MDFNEISALSILAPIFVGAFSFSKIDQNLRILFYLVIASALIEVGAMYLYRQKINNMFTLHIQTFVEFYFLIYFYHRIFRRIVSQKLARIFAVVFLVLTPLCFFRDSIYEFNTVQRYFEILFLMIIMFAFLYETLIFDSKIRRRKSPFFWFTAGYLVYFAGTLLLFIMQQEFVESGFYDYWIVHGIFNIILNLVITFVLWTGREQYSS